MLIGSHPPAAPGQIVESTDTGIMYRTICGSAADCRTPEKKALPGETVVDRSKNQSRYPTKHNAPDDALDEAPDGAV